MDSIPGINRATTPAASSRTEGPSAPAPSTPRLSVESIMQRERGYFNTITPALKPAVEAAKLDTSEKRLDALGEQLLYISNPCTIGKLKLQQFIAQHPDQSERGQALMEALPAVGDPKFTFGSLAYQTMLTNAAFPDNRLGPVPREHSAFFLNQAAEPPAQ